MGSTALRLFIVLCVGLLFVSWFAAAPIPGHVHQHAHRSRRDGFQQIQDWWSYITSPISGYGGKNTEGFIGFGSDIKMQGTIIVPMYSPKSLLVKVYDNVYFDPVNGNLVELNGPSATSVAGSTAAITPLGVVLPSVSHAPGPTSGTTPSIVPTIVPSMGAAGPSTANPTPSAVGSSATVPVLPGAKATPSMTSSAPAPAPTPTPAPVLTPTSSVTASATTNTNTNTSPASTPGANTTPLASSSNTSAPAASISASVSGAGASMTGAPTTASVPPTAGAPTTASAQTPALKTAEKFTTQSEAVTSITVITRKNHIVSYSVVSPNGAEESNLGMVPSTSTFYYNTSAPSTDMYAVYYVAWNSDTYIHVINTTNNSHVCSQYFGSTGPMGAITYSNSPIVFSAGNSTMNDVPVNKQAVLPAYDGTVSLAQITPTVHVDPRNGYLIVTNPGTGLVVLYDQYGAEVKTGQSRVTSATPTPALVAWSVVQGTNLLIYMTHQKSGLVIVIQNAGTVAAPKYTLINAVGFELGAALSSASGPSSSGPLPGPLTGPLTGTGGAGGAGGQNATIILPISSSSGNFNQQIDQDTVNRWIDAKLQRSNLPANDFNSYLLKSQLVSPIVCTCTGDCGCNKPSSTKDPTPSVAETRTQTNTSGSTGIGGIIDRIFGYGEHAVTGTSNLGKDIATGTVDLGKDAVTGTVGLGKDAVVGATNLAKDAVTGAVGLGKDVVSGTTDLAKDAVTGTVRLGKEGARSVANSTDTTQVQGTTQSQRTAQVQGVDLFSAYGALPSKESNFRPTPSNFSSFGK